VDADNCLNTCVIAICGDGVTFDEVDLRRLVGFALLAPHASRDAARERLCLAC
jgi:hypothetical protein